MTRGLATEIPKRLPPGADSGGLTGGAGVGAVLDPGSLSGVPPAVTEAIRGGLAASLHPVFVAGIPILAAAFIATLFIKQLPLREVSNVEAERTGQQSPEETKESKESKDAARA
jgi:hypothetical protein